MDRKVENDGSVFYLGFASWIQTEFPLIFWNEVKYSPQPFYGIQQTNYYLQCTISCANFVFLFHILYAYTVPKNTREVLTVKILRQSITRKTIQPGLCSKYDQTNALPISLPYSPTHNQSNTPNTNNSWGVFTHSGQRTTLPSSLLCLSQNPEQL